MIVTLLSNRWTRTNEHKNEQDLIIFGKVIFHIVCVRATQFWYWFYFFADNFVEMHSSDFIVQFLSLYHTSKNKNEKSEVNTFLLYKFNYCGILQWFVFLCKLTIHIYQRSYSVNLFGITIIPEFVKRHVQIMKFQITLSIIKITINVITIFMPTFTIQVSQNSTLIIAGKNEPNILFTEY